MEFDFLWELVYEADCFDGTVKKHCPKLEQLDKLEKELVVFAKAIPYLGYKLDKFFSAGVILNVVLHKELQMFGRLSFNTGMRWKMPPHSRFFLDLNNKKKSKMEIKTLTKPDFFLEPKQGNMEAQFLTFFGPRFDVGVSLFDKVELELQTQFRSPAFTLNISAGYRESSQCLHVPCQDIAGSWTVNIFFSHTGEEGYCTGKKVKTGLKIVLQANLQVWAKIPNPDWGALVTAATSVIGGLNLPEVPDWNDLSDSLRGTADTIGGAIGDAWDSIFKRDAEPDGGPGYFRIDDDDDSPDLHITNAHLGIGDDAHPEFDESGSQPTNRLGIRTDPNHRQLERRGKHSKPKPKPAKWWQDRLYVSSFHLPSIAIHSCLREDELTNFVMLD
jgi:hypothetical protein